MYPIELLSKLKKKDLVMLLNHYTHHSDQHMMVMIEYMLDGFTFKKAHKEAMKLVGE